MPNNEETDVSRRDFQKLLGVSGAAVLGGVSLAGCQGETSASIPCPYCDDTFESESALKDHLPSAHAEELRSALGSGPIQCPYGDQEFDSLEALREHIKSEHPDEVTLPDWDEETEIAVVGAGFAGLAAAIEAAEAGAEVRIFEKMSRPGGNSRINGGGMSIVGSDQQSEQGIDDSVELFMEDLLEAGRGLNQPELIEFVGENTKATYDWTVDELGVEWSNRLMRFGGHSVPRSVTTADGSGWGVVSKELDKLEELGVEVETGKKLVDLYQNGDGEVVGIRIHENFTHGEPGSGDPVDVRTTDGLILATGGFAEDIEWRTDQMPTIGEDVNTTNHPGATGEAVRSAIDTGANPVHLSWIQLGPWTCPEEKGFGTGPFFANEAAGPYGVWIDPETGKRFVDELADRRTRAQAELDIGKEPEYPLAMVDASGAEHARPDTFKSQLEREVVYEFDSLEAVAENFGIPLEPFKEQIETYNSLVRSGTDEQFGKIIPEDAKPLETPPYYVMRLWPKVHHTMGGIEIDTDARVQANTGAGSIDEGDLVPNLYAAGEAAGGIHGGCRLGTVAVASCLIYGRVAGAVAAGGENPYT